MNIFRLLADALHATSIIFLIRKIRATRNVNGLSLKTQLLYIIVYITRYLDLFWNFKSLYNYLFKLFYIITSVYVLYLITNRYKDSYVEAKDRTPVLYLIGPAFGLSLIFARPWTPFEIIWTFSLFLEAVAMVPQFHMLYISKITENFSGDYIAALGAYRFFYILNWLYRRFVDDHSMPFVVWVSGIIQTVMYVEFLFYWWKARTSNKLPSTHSGEEDAHVTRLQEPLRIARKTTKNME
eukprot:gnl/Dysnectes_brevis/2993_a3691_1344.p1 GENE.gnl/Dysnectes_brevis/2993_a3691_1344~~gnl/Dysnectes_brevis/2993_a3691_1344.p1  ORF type:complete len:239 (-),score=46.72 gnl/Dysnectes_brevis/2993_a3691_1344:44-760(-)